MGAVCCKREPANDLLLTDGDHVVMNYRGKPPSCITEFKEEPSTNRPLNSSGPDSRGRKKSNPRGREARFKKNPALKSTYARGASRGSAAQRKGGAGGNQMPTTGGMTAGHKYRKNNLQLAVVPYGETEENFDSEDGDGDTDAVPSRGFKQRSRSHIKCKVVVPPQQQLNEPFKFASKKYGNVKARYMDNFHGADSKAGSALVNYTTSIPAVGSSNASKVGTTIDQNKSLTF